MSELLEYLDHMQNCNAPKNTLDCQGTMQGMYCTGRYYVRTKAGKVHQYSNSEGCKSRVSDKACLQRTFAFYFYFYSKFASERRRHVSV